MQTLGRAAFGNVFNYLWILIAGFVSFKPCYLLVTVDKMLHLIVKLLILFVAVHQQWYWQVLITKLIRANICTAAECEAPSGQRFMLTSFSDTYSVTSGAQSIHIAHYNTRTQGRCGGSSPWG